MNDKLQQILEAIGEGDDLALGELPSVLAGSRAGEIETFSKGLGPILAAWRDEPRRHVAEMLQDAYSKAIRMESLDRMMAPDFLGPVQLKPCHQRGDPQPDQIMTAARGLGKSDGFIESFLIRPLPRFDMRDIMHYTSKLGLHRGENRVARHPDNDPVSCAAKGLKAFTIEGEEVWAGTEKAARKKYRLMMAQAQ